VRRIHVRPLAGLLSAALALSGAAHAARPENGAIGLQPPATELARDVQQVHNLVLMPVITVVSLVVMALLLLVMVRYRKGSGRVPANFSHNTAAEIAWTIIPVFILVVIAAFSFPLLYKIDRNPTYKIVDGMQVPLDASDWLTVKVQGNQWNWTYSYTDERDAEGFPLVEFVSNPRQRGLSSDAAARDPAVKYLEVDYPMVVPAGRYVRYQTGASDVIHSFAMPSFGIKTDAVPGRQNEGWFKVDTPGVYYGQCSELCGKDHAFMPIEIRVVPEAQYQAWYEAMKAGDPDAAVTLVADIQPVSAPQFASAAR
jgi:cytochrome c oxidase subunit 2